MQPALLMAVTSLLLLVIMLAIGCGWLYVMREQERNKLKMVKAALSQKPVDGPMVAPYGTIDNPIMLPDIPWSRADESLVDPWMLQLQLMLASDQEVAREPAVTNTTLLYFALICEEASETADALDAVLMRAWPLHLGRAIEQTEVSILISEVAGFLKRQSRDMRKLLADMGPISIPMRQPEAKELLDGTTDITVVNAGFCLSMGLSGSEAYRRVLTSNLSKRNDRGTIDKTPDGKWIKGPNYVEPNLDELVATALPV